VRAMRIAEVYAFGVALAGQIVPTKSARSCPNPDPRKNQKSKSGEIGRSGESLKTFGNREG